MSAEDLIPFNRRTEDEQKEIAKKGGLKSGETRRRKRALKQIARHFLDAETGRDELRAELLESGFDDDTSNAAALVMRIAKEAFSGNMRAAELLIKLSGEDPDQKRKDKELKLKQDFYKFRMASGEVDIEDLSFLSDMLKDGENDEAAQDTNTERRNP